MKTGKLFCFCFVLLFTTCSRAADGFTEIGTGTSQTQYIPLYGYYSYGWSQTIYLQSEISDPFLISGISYYVNNQPSSYVMPGQRIYLKHAQASSFAAAYYDDPESEGFTQVYSGTVTWNGTGWHKIDFDSLFLYNGVDNLIVYWQNHDGSWNAGFPIFRCSSASNRSKYKYADWNFPAYDGSRSSSVPNIRLHYAEWNPAPANGEEAVAVDRNPTLSWNNQDGIVSNALYFSTDSASVAQAQSSALVLAAPAVHSDYLHTSALERGTAYHWMVRQFFDGFTIDAGPYSFTTEPDPVSTFPWNVDFENSGLKPDYWFEEFVDGERHWSYRRGSPKGVPEAPWQGSYNAAFGGAGTLERTRLITPVIDLSGASAPVLTFMHAQAADSGITDELHIYYRTASDSPWTALPGGEFTASTPQWTRRVLPLPSGSATYYIAFEARDNGGCGVCIDDLRLLSESAELTLRIYDCHGDPLGAAPFTFFAPSDNATPFDYGESDPDGYAFAAGLAAGEAIFRVDEAFHNVAEGSVTLAPGESVTQRVDLAASTHLSGVVREINNSGERIEGAAVSLLKLPPDSELVASDTTDAFGQYRFGRVPDGSYRLRSTHPAYVPAETGITVNASISHTLFMQPLSGDFFDVHVQVNCALSGLPIENTAVKMTVRESAGMILFQETGYTDSDGALCFRGVQPGTASFECNAPGVHHRSWWESHTAGGYDVGNSKLVNVRLEPKKSATTLDLDFDAVNFWGQPVDPAPYIQNFWVEARGYNPDKGNFLYPARTELTDHEGKVTFDALPTLPTLLTVRRPGFVEQSTLIYPDANAVFPTPIVMERPLITPGTAWDLTVEQDLFQKIPQATSYMPSIIVEGLPNSNSEGYLESYRYSVQPFTEPPMTLATAHGEMSAWGRSRYRLSPGSDGYIEPLNGVEGFYCKFDFAPQIAGIAEGESNEFAFSAAFLPSTVEGRLFAADEVTENGLTVSKPAAGKEIQFVLHEGIRHMYHPGHEVHVTTTDTNGYYRIRIPPGCYGIEIPSMPGYWGHKIQTTSLIGWSGNDGGWPYARTNNWSDTGSSSVYDHNGIGLSSGHHTIIDLYVNRQLYCLQLPLTETSPVQTRVLYCTAEIQPYAVRNVKDLVESGTALALSRGETADVQISRGGLWAVWTNLVGGTFTIDSDDHPYLSPETILTRTTFTWGDYPGQPPATMPPMGTEFNNLPLPMVAKWLPSVKMVCDNTLTNSPEITVIYYDGDQEPSESQVYPYYVEFKDLTNKLYECSAQIDRDRVQRYFFPFTLHNGTRKIYSVPGTGPFVVNTITTPGTVLPLSPYNLDVIAVNSDNQAESIPDFPFMLDSTSYLAPRTFEGLETSAYIDWDPNAPSAWQKYSNGSIYYSVDPTNSPLLVTARLYCRPKINVSGTVRNAVSGLTVPEASIDIRRSNGSNTGIDGKSDNSGNFVLGYVYSFEGHLINVTAPGYLPYSRRYPLGSHITATNTFNFVVDLGDIPLTPVSMTASKEGWDRQGHVLHGVQAAGSAEQPETSAAVQLTVSATANVPQQMYGAVPYDKADNTPSPAESNLWDDAVTDIWLIDARYKDQQGVYTPYQQATSQNYYPANATFLPPPSDPDKIRKWLDKCVQDTQLIVALRPAAEGVAVTATGQVSVATLRHGELVPVIVAQSRSGAFKMLSIDDATITSVKLPRWLAFAADTFAGIAAAQSAYGDLKETYLSKVPDGKLSALPSFSGGISEADGYLTYGYSLGVEWEEGSDAPSEGGLSIGPGMLGLQFESEAGVEFSGRDRTLAFSVGGSVGKEDIDLADYAPAFLGKLGIEGNINKVFGRASTRRSVSLGGDQWSDRELCTSLGAGLDLTLRYNLEGITGKIPYVGPLITLADKSNALRMFGRLDAGGRVQNTSTWRTLEPGRAADVGSPDPFVSRPVILRTDDLELTPNRHCFGGQENNSGVYSNDFRLGLHFGAGFEGSALGDHLNVYAGMEITGNESDLVAGEPSLVITPNTFGDWPPIKRAQGDVNAFVRARLDAYITEIEKDWTINLARIDHQFTTESLITLADLVVNVVERPVESTEFTGVRPTVVRNLPRGSSFAIVGGVLAFGMYDQTVEQTDLVVSLADGDGFTEPVTVASDVEGLGKVKLFELDNGELLLIWEERPGLSADPRAYSVIHAARFNGTLWQTPQLVTELHSYLDDLELFSSAKTNSLVYTQSPSLENSGQSAIRAVGYDRSADSWGDATTVQPVASRGDLAMAGFRHTSPEPGRVIYTPAGGGVVSLYWDGERSSVPGGDATRDVTPISAERLALCAAGTNELLFATLLTETGELLLHAYLPDPARDPLNPEFDWNSRTAAQMWPFVTNITEIAGTTDDLASGWLPGCESLLNAWSQLGAIRINGYTPGQTAIQDETLLASSAGGSYSELQITPVSNTLARIAACYTSTAVRELRIFEIEAGTLQNSEDLDGDGIPDLRELALVDADPDDAINDIRDVNGNDDFDGDGIDNATEWSAGSRPDLAASRPSTGVEIYAATALACEDGLLPGSFLITRGENDSSATALTVGYAVAGSAGEDIDYTAIARSIEIPAGVRDATLVIQPLADTRVEGQESVIVTLLPHASYTLGIETQAVVRIQDTTRDNWRNTHFTPQQLALPGISGDEADPDNDGIPNALELALGSDPWSADPTELAMTFDDTYIYFGYIYDPQVEDAFISILNSTNLLDSTWTPSIPELIYRETRPDRREEIYYRLLREQENAFFRLGVDTP